MTYDDNPSVNRQNEKKSAEASKKPRKGNPEEPDVRIRKLGTKETPKGVKVKSGMSAAEMAQQIEISGGRTRSLIPKASLEKGKLGAIAKLLQFQKEKRKKLESAIVEAKKEAGIRFSPTEKKFEEDLTLTLDDLARAVSSARERLEEKRRYRKFKQGNKVDGKIDIAMKVLQQVFEREKVLQEEKEEIIRRQDEERKRKEEMEEHNRETTAENEELLQAELEKRERELEGFKGVNRNLIDDAKELIEENQDAAAKVMQQWIGNPTDEK